MTYPRRRQMILIDRLKRSVCQISDAPELARSNNCRHIRVVVQDIFRNDTRYYRGIHIVWSDDFHMKHNRVERVLGRLDVIHRQRRCKGSIAFVFVTEQCISGAHRYWITTDWNVLSIGVSQDRWTSRIFGKIRMKTSDLATLTSSFQDPCLLSFSWLNRNSAWHCIDTRGTHSIR